MLPIVRAADGAGADRSRVHAIPRGPTQLGKVSAIAARSVRGHLSHQIAGQPGGGPFGRAQQTTGKRRKQQPRRPQNALAHAMNVSFGPMQVRGFVGCHKMLERDLYLLVCLAFNHWHTGLDDPSQYPQCVLAIHSSKRLLVEQIVPPPFILADAIINLTLAKGQRHEGREGMTAYYLTKVYHHLTVLIRVHIETNALAHPNVCRAGPG